MLKPGLLKRFGIVVPEGEICTMVHVTVPGAQGKPKIIETITKPKRLAQRAGKLYGATLRPVFVPVSSETI